MGCVKAALLALWALGVAAAGTEDCADPASLCNVTCSGCHDLSGLGVCGPAFRPSQAAWRLLAAVEGPWCAGVSVRRLAYRLLPPPWPVECLNASRAGHRFRVAAVVSGKGRRETALAEAERHIAAFLLSQERAGLGQGRLANLSLHRLAVKAGRDWGPSEVAWAGLGGAWLLVGFTAAARLFLCLHSPRN